MIILNNKKVSAATVHRGDVSARTLLRNSKPRVFASARESPRARREAERANPSRFLQSTINSFSGGAATAPIALATKGNSLVGLRSFQASKPTIVSATKTAHTTARSDDGNFVRESGSWMER